jgi:protein-S-isoprenylcysteine O-methyltransferase Ste14
VSLVPAFEIGVWNAWIFMVYYILGIPLIRLINKGSVEKNDVAAPAYKGTEDKIVKFYQLCYVLLLIYSVFLPLRLGTTWLYIGLAICLLGLITLTITMVNFATTPLDELVSKGLYRYSRHPIYLTQFLMFIGVGIASASWVFLLLSILRTIASFMLLAPEERFCLQKYGNAYREYMERTPRWLGIPKSGAK